MKYLFILIFAVTALFGVAQVDITSNLVLCLPMNGNANDFSGNNNNGVVSGATFTTNRFGASNSAYHFNGVNNFISVPSSTSISNIENSDELTISAWCNPKNWYMNWNIFAILEKYNPNSDSGWGLMLVSANAAPGVDITFIHDYSLMAYQNSTVGVVLGQWAFFSVTYSKSSQLTKFYKDGVLIQTYNNAGAQLENTGAGPVQIGYSQLGPNEYSDGDIDDVRMYNRALTGQEINTLYQQEYSCSGELRPVATFSISKKQVCTRQSVLLTDQSLNTPTSWNWQMQGGTPSTSSLSNPTVSFANPGTYTITLTSSNGAGQSNTSVQTITVSACTAIAEQLDKSSPEVYPNPSHGKLYVSNPGNNSIEMYNLLGQKMDVTKIQINENVIELLFDKQLHGIYLLHLSADQGSYLKTTRISIE